MPSVARNIFFSAATPILRTFGKTSEGGIFIIPPLKPSSANSVKLSARAAALLMNVKKSISLCAPELFLSTSPGLGVADTSSSIASSARPPISLLVIFVFVLVIVLIFHAVFASPESVPPKPQTPNAFIRRRYREHCEHTPCD